MRRKQLLTVIMTAMTEALLVIDVYVDAAAVSEILALYENREMQIRYCKKQNWNQTKMAPICISDL